MQSTNVNIDFCGIINLLNVLKVHGYSEKEIKKIEARLAAQTGADIILFP